MSKGQIKTNNDSALIEKKIQLRLESLPDKEEIKILEAFGGEGILWNEVKKRTDKKIKILSIDKNDYKKINLKGDNIKFLKSINLDDFDIIDLDSWGSPSNQLDILKSKKYKGIIHCTFIQTMMGKVNNNILLSNGYTKKMINKCPTLFNKNGIDKLLNFISINFGVSKFRIVTNNNKNYFYFIVS